MKVVLPAPLAPAVLATWSKNGIELVPGQQQRGTLMGSQEAVLPSMMHQGNHQGDHGARQVANPRSLSSSRSAADRKAGRRPAMKDRACTHERGEDAGPECAGDALQRFQLLAIMMTAASRLPHFCWS